MKFVRIFSVLFFSLFFANHLSATDLNVPLPDSKDDPPGSLYILSIVNNAACVALKPTFSWNTPAGTLPMLYNIKLSRGNTPLDSIVTTDTAYTLTYDLEPNTTYRWYLTATNNAGISVTNTRTFITGQIPGDPVQIYPLSGALVPINVTFNWTTSVGCPPVKHTVQVWDANSGSFIVNNPNVTGGSIQLSLAAGRIYQWRIRGTNSFGQTPFTGWQSFSTGVNLSAPVLSSPSSGSSSSVPQIPLKWFSSYQADSYVIQISSNPEFTYPLIIYRTVQDTFYNFNLLNPQTHYWRVQAKNSLIGSSSPFSEVYSFIVNQLSLSTTTVSPSGTCVSLLPQLKWRKAGEDPSILYNLEVSSAGIIYVSQAAIIDTSYTLTSPLPVNSDIDWHVTPYLSTGSGTAAIGNFKTTGPPPAVQMHWPHCGEEIPNTYVQFSWSDIVYCPPVSYRVQFISNGGLNIDTVTNLPGVLISYLSPYTDYTLKVTAINAFGPGPVLDSCTYTTYPGMDISDETQITEYSLSQNYPNPFNPVTKINYRTALSGLVNLTIYDILGNEIEQLVNGFKEPGRYEVTFDGSSLGSGVYFYKLTVNDYSSVKKLIIMK